MVIAIIALLAALLLPALSAAKKKAQQTYCTNNMKQFALCLRLYADDFHNNFVPYEDAGGWYAPPTLAPFTGVSPEAALANCQQALTNSLLFPYAKNIGIFVCPGDTRVLQPPGQGFACGTYSKTQNYAGDPTAAWGMDALCEKDADVAAPAETFATIEDTDSRGYNEGTWVVKWAMNGDEPGSFTWEDPPAQYHVNTDIWSFCDSHVAPHKWTDQSIISNGQQAAKGVSVFGFVGPKSGPDYDFVRNGLRFPGWQ